MATLPKSLATASQITQQVGSMIPLGQISSVVQTLQNIQGFNPGSFSQLAGTIKSALTGIEQATSIVQNFSGNSPIAAFTNTLSATGLAGSSISGIAGTAASAYQQADSFLNSTSSFQSFQRLNSRRPSVEESREFNNVGGGLQFPKDIGKYWIYLGFEEFNYSANFVGGSTGFVYSRKGMGGVTLPVPMNLTDTNKLEYQPIQLSNKILGTITNAARMIPGIGNIVDTLTNVAGAGVEVASATTGYALNTAQTLKFVQPTLKSHTFSWKLVPSSKEESEALAKIIRFVKTRIYPNLAGGGSAYRYPNIVNVYLYNGKEMYFFKPAYVEAFAVNYTTEGGPAFHKDKYPVSVQIDMSITENSVWLGSDFQGQ